MNALIDLIVLGEYGGMISDDKGGKGRGVREMEGLKLRAEGLSIFEVSMYWIIGWLMI